jgi:Kef-type K+ transport system membrane component KefB
LVVSEQTDDVLEPVAIWAVPIAPVLTCGAMVAAWELGWSSPAMTALGVAVMIASLFLLTARADRTRKVRVRRGEVALFVGICLWIGLLLAGHLLARAVGIPNDGSGPFSSHRTSFTWVFSLSLLPVVREHLGLTRDDD